MYRLIVLVRPTNWKSVASNEVAVTQNWNQNSTRLRLQSVHHDRKQSWEGGWWLWPNSPLPMPLQPIFELCPPLYCFLITHSRAPLDEWWARRRGLYLHGTPPHINTRDKQPCLQRDSNPPSQQPSGRRPTTLDLAATEIGRLSSRRPIKMDIQVWWCNAILHQWKQDYLYRVGATWASGHSRTYVSCSVLTKHITKCIKEIRCQR
jgi:hypothetical protein